MDNEQGAIFTNTKTGAKRYIRQSEIAKYGIAPEVFKQKVAEQAPTSYGAGVTQVDINKENFQNQSTLELAAKEAALKKTQSASERQTWLDAIKGTIPDKSQEIPITVADINDPEKMVRFSQLKSEGYNVGLPKTQMQIDKQKADLQKQDVVNTAQSLQDLLNQKGTMNSKEYEDAKNSITSDLYLKMKEAAKLGTQLTPGEIAILAGKAPRIEGAPAGINKLWTELITGHAAPVTGKVLDDEATLRNKLNYIINGTNAAGTTQAPGASTSTETPTVSSNFTDNASVQKPQLQLPNIPQINMKEGLPGAVTNALPFIGGAAGMMIGGAAAGPFGALPLGAALSGAGEGAKQLLQGDKLDPNKIQNETRSGLAAAATGEALGPAVKLAEKLPIVGPIIEGISGFGKGALEKIFGKGSAEMVAKYKIPVNSNDPEILAQGVKTIKTSLGEQLGGLLDQATKDGVRTTFKDVTEMFNKAIPSTITEEKKQAYTELTDIVGKMIMKDPLRYVGRELTPEEIKALSTQTIQQMFGDVSNPLGRAMMSASRKAGMNVVDNLPITPRLLQDIKLGFGDNNPAFRGAGNATQQAQKNIYFQLKNKIESVIPKQDVRGLNADIEKLREMEAFLQEAADKAVRTTGTGLSATRILANPLLGTIAGHRTVNQLGSTLPKLGAYALGGNVSAQLKQNELPNIPQ